jgi:hypothetical protein
MLNPWDDREQVRLLHETELCIVGITVNAPEDVDDDRFSLMFETSDHRVLRLRLPIAQLIELAETLLHLRDARRSLGAD